jgi:hypothetical protein
LSQQIDFLELFVAMRLAILEIDIDRRLCCHSLMDVLPSGLQDFSPSRCEQSALPAGLSTEGSDSTGDGSPGRKIARRNIDSADQPWGLVIHGLCGHSQTHVRFTHLEL